MNGNQPKDKPESGKCVFFEEKKRNSDDVIFSKTDCRTNQRVDVEFEVTLTGPHIFFTGITMDISEGGVFIATHQIYSLGTEFKLNLILGSEKLEISSIVVWVRAEDSSRISGEEIGMGLKFMNLDEKSLSVISAFIKKREPLLYDSQL